MSGKIFINYRRDDDPGNTGRLFDRLENAFQPGQLFFDVDSVHAGVDFVRLLEEQVAQCDVLLAVIGKDWINARDQKGTRRLDDPSDFVRIEIESALTQGKRVIPVLVHGARMPQPDELPETLRPLVRRQARRLSHEQFKDDAQKLVRELREALEEAEALRRAQAEAERKAEADAERKRNEEAERLREGARREAEEQARLAALRALSPEQITRAEELANWDYIKNTTRPQDIRDHLARYPGGASERWARRRLEALEWDKLGSAPNREALESYLKEFPDCEPARSAIAALDRAEEEERRRQAEAEARREAEEERRRHEAQARLRAEEEERRRQEIEVAQRQADKELRRKQQEAFSQAIVSGDTAVLKEFLRTYPTRPQADKIRDRLRRLESQTTMFGADLSTLKVSEDRKSRENADRRRQAEEELRRKETKAFNQAIVSGDAAVLKEFLRTYPTGPQADKIRDRLQRLKSHTTIFGDAPASRRALLLCAVGLVGLISLSTCLKR